MSPIPTRSAARRPLFYGPIQQGKDGWNAAFFCGSNAVLRREALMQLGVVGYVEATERAVQVGTAPCGFGAGEGWPSDDSQRGGAGAGVGDGARRRGLARAAVAAGEPLSQVTYRFQRQVDRASRDVVHADLDLMQDTISPRSPSCHPAERDATGRR